MVKDPEKVGKMGLVGKNGNKEHRNQTEKCNTVRASGKGLEIETEAHREMQVIPRISLYCVPGQLI